MSERVTIADVARLANVSAQTVSRVINGKPDVSPNTRQRVLQIIAETGYRPSHIARGLATDRSATIGLVAPDISNPYFSDIALSVEQTARAQGYSVLLGNTSEEPEREVEILHTLEAKRVDGVIACSLRQEGKLLEDLLARFAVAVLVNRRLSKELGPVVMVDDVWGGCMATQHLLASGHRAIGFLAGPRGSTNGARRAQGYRQALEAAQVEPRGAWIRYCMPMTGGGEQATYDLLKSQPELTALFCYNDLIAVGALQACRALGRRVPEDIAIVGFDDIFLAPLVTPPLTTCRVPRAEMGRRATNLLLSRLRGQADPSAEYIAQPELIVRASAP